MWYIWAQQLSARADLLFSSRLSYISEAEERRCCPCTALCWAQTCSPATWSCKAAGRAAEEPALLLLLGPHGNGFSVKLGVRGKKIIEPLKLTQAACFLSLQKKRVTHAGCVQPTEAQLFPETRTQMSFPYCFPPSLFLFCHCNFRHGSRWKRFFHCNTRSFLLLPATSVMPCYFLFLLLPEWALMELPNDNKPSLQ